MLRGIVRAAPLLLPTLGLLAARLILGHRFAVMSDETQKPLTSDLLRDSLLYRHFQAQREEILKHKWYESEKAGHDIGFDQALTDWTIKHRAQWLKRRQGETGASRIRTS